MRSPPQFAFQFTILLSNPSHLRRPGYLYRRALQQNSRPGIDLQPPTAPAETVCSRVLRAKRSLSTLLRQELC